MRESWAGEEAMGGAFKDSLKNVRVVKDAVREAGRSRRRWEKPLQLRRQWEKPGDLVKGLYTLHDTTLIIISIYVSL